MNVHENPNHDDLLERATEALRRAPIPTGPPSDLITDVVVDVEREEAASKIQPQALLARIYSMKPTTKLMAVAVLFVGICGLFAWLAPSRQALAFERVAKAFASIQSATCDMTLEMHDVEDQAKLMFKHESRVMFLAPSQERIETKVTPIDGAMEPAAAEIFGGMTTIVIYDIPAGKGLSLMPKQKMAVVYDIENAPEGLPRNGQFESLRERFREAQTDPKKGSRPLAEKLIDGVRAVGFRLDGEMGTTDVWADPETALPIRVEATVDDKPNARMVVTNFRYDVELDESLFSFAPPEGYTVRKMTLDVSPPTIEDLGDLLRFAAQHCDGAFPEELEGPKGVDLIRSNLMKEVQDEHGLDSPEWKKSLMDYTNRMARGRRFIKHERPKSEWRYQGGGVKLGDADTAIFWFRPQESATYQVLYGDLRVEKGVAETDLPKE